MFTKFVADFECASPEEKTELRDSIMFALVQFKNENPGITGLNVYSEMLTFAVGGT
jgi:hypothetical protein